MAPPPTPGEWEVEVDGRGREVTKSTRALPTPAAGPTLSSHPGGGPFHPAGPKGRDPDQ